MSKWQWSQLIGFQCFWLLAVVGQNSSTALLCLLLLSHFVFTPSRAQDARVLLLAGLGISVDFLLSLSGVFVFNQPPFWLGLLWLGFVLTLGHSMGWLSRLKWPWLMVIGALSGPSSYLAGWRLEAVTLPLGISTTLFILVPIWALLLPLLIRWQQQLSQGAH